MGFIMIKSISRTLTLAKRNLLEIVRDPLSLIFTLAMPLAMEALFYLLFHGKTSQFEMKYLAPGIVGFSQAFLSLFTGILIALDRSTSFLTRLYVSKARSREFIFSYALAILPLSLAQSILFFLVGGIFDVSIFCPQMAAAIAFSLITSLFYIAVGILLGSVCNEKSIGGVSSVVIAGQSILSGMWFPVEGLNEGFITAMNVLPFKNVTLVLQNSLLDVYTFEDFFLPLIIVAAYSIVVFSLAILFFKKNMRSK